MLQIHPHLRSVSRPMQLPSFAQQGGDFESICAEGGPVSALQIKVCAVYDVIQIVILSDRQAPWVK